MKSGPFFLGISFALFSAPVVSANPSHPARLDEAEVLEQIRSRHPLLRSADTDREASVAEARAAGGAFDPVLKYQHLQEVDGAYGFRYQDLSVEQTTGLYGTKWVAGVRRGLGDYPIYDEKLRTNQDGEWRVGLEVPLLRNGMTDERRTRNRTANLAADGANRAFEQQTLDLYRQGLHRYWDWALARGKRKASEHLLRIAQTRDDFLSARVKRGDAAQMDSLDNRRLIVQRESQLVSARRQEQRAALELSLFLWENPTERRAIDEKTEAEPVQLTDRDRLLVFSPAANERLPELQGLSFLRDSRVEELRLARNLMLPRLDFTTSLSRDYGPGIAKWNQNEVRVGLLFEIPLFQNTAIGRRAQANARLLRTELQLEYSRARWENARTDFRQALEAIRLRYEQAATEVNLSRKLEDLEKERFTHGDSSLVILNLREQATLESEIKYLETVSEWKKLSVDAKWLAADLKP